MAAAPGSYTGNAMSQQMRSNLRNSFLSCRAARGTSFLSMKFGLNSVTSPVFQTARLRPHSVRSVALVLGSKTPLEWSESACLVSLIQSWTSKATDMRANFCTFNCSNVGAGVNLERPSVARNCPLRSLPTAARGTGDIHISMRSDSHRKPSFYPRQQFLLPSAYYVCIAAPGSFGPGKFGKSGKFKGWKRKRAKVVNEAGNVTDGSSKKSRVELISKRKSVSKKLEEEPAGTKKLKEEPASRKKLKKEPAGSRKLKEEPAGTKKLNVEPGSSKEHVLGEGPVLKEALVIVESPAKAKTIEKYLGDKFLVLASYGHIRDLASRAGSVRPDENFHMVWEVSASAQPHLNCMKSALAMCNSLVLASDPDREGEAIAWHVLEMLTVEGAIKSHHVVRRVVFHEITQSAVLQAMESPRDISDSLVSAYLARRALDYIIGFDLSPLLWRKLPGSKSAGRVQSAALRLITERETEIEAFTPQEYWSVEAQVSLSPACKKSLKADPNMIYPARLTHFMGEKLGQFSLTTETALAAAKRVEESKLVVASMKSSVVRRTPPAPYTTSTLQQDASNKLSFGVPHTMTIAQQLYEGVKLENDEVTGLITYMRTDSVQISLEALEIIRSTVRERYGDKLLPASPRVYQSKAKNAQEAHEAIRPTDARRLPSSLVNVLAEDSLQLYSLIWCRAVASQMEAATLNQVAADIINDDNSVELRCSGSAMAFPGFRVVHKDKEALAVQDGTVMQEDDEEGVNLLPTFQLGDGVVVKQVQPNQHFTEALPRYSEASLVKNLEELGIGRPSTYASIMKTLQARTYIRIVKRRIFPEIRGRMVSVFLCRYFEQFVNYEFTANLESQLDEISAGRLEWRTFLSSFWPKFHEAVVKAMTVPIEQVVGILEETFSKQLFPEDRLCPRCREGTVSLKLSRYGAGYFLGCSRFPECHFRANIFKSDDEETASGEGELEVLAPRVLGQDPLTGLEVLDKTGPFGRYVQLGHGPKSERRPLPKNREELTLESALHILSYPKLLGVHPDGGETVTLGMGRKSLQIRHKGVSVTVPEEFAAEAITLDVAVELIRLLGGLKRGRRPRTLSPEQETNIKERSRLVKLLCVAATAEAELRKEEVKKEAETPQEADVTTREREETKVPPGESAEVIAGCKQEADGKVKGKGKANSRKTDAGSPATKKRKAEPAVAKGDGLASSSKDQIIPEAIQPSRQRGRLKAVRSVA